MLSSIPLCQQQPGFCLDTVVHVCLSGFDVIIVCLRASDTKDYLKSDMSSQSIRTERQKSNSNGISNHLQMWLRSYLQKSHFIYFLLSWHPKVDRVMPKNGSELAGWTYASSQAGLFWSSAFSFCAQNTWNNLLNVLHSSTHYPRTIQEDLRNTVFYNSCQWALFFWNTLDIFVHADIFPNEGNLDFWGLHKSLERFECFVVWNAAGVTRFIDFQKPYLRSLFISEWTLSLEKTVCVIMKNP